MRITSLSLRNFKAIGSTEQRVEFKPITLLFGPNSAGKSTIVQALHYLSEILGRNNCDPGTTQLGGKLNLGGFRNLVHMHDDSTVIELSVGIELGDSLLPSDGDASESESQNLEMALNGAEGVFDLSDVGEVELRVSVAWSHFRDTAYVQKYSVALDGELFSEITCSEDMRTSVLSHFNHEHRHFAVKAHDDEDAPTVGELLGEFVESHSQRVDSAPISYLPMQLAKGRGAMPYFDTDLPLVSSGNVREILVNEDPSLLSEDEKEQRINGFRFGFFKSYLSRAIVGAGILVNQCLNDFIYLGPLRDIPGRHYSPELSPDLARWSSGLAAWDQLYNEGASLAEKINAWLADDSRLDSGYEVHYSEYKPLELDSALVVALKSGRELVEDTGWIQEQLDAVPTRRQVTLRDLRGNIDLHPEDLGTGISQVLPVLVAALGHNKNIVAIEQPELHVHPKFQVALGELFIHAIRDERIAQDTVFLLETHSEYMMLRLLRRLYETANDELEPEAEALTPEDIGVYYVNPTGDMTEIVQLRLTEEGEFIDRWPNGFFPERKKELF